MYKIKPSNRFKKDVRLAQRRGYKIEQLTYVLKKLAAGEKLDAKFRDHELEGDYKGYRECHILPDWLLVYQIIEDELILYLARCGSHSDLF